MNVCIVNIFFLCLHLLLNCWGVWAPQMTSQPVSSIFLCSPMPSGTCWTPGLSIPDVVFPPIFLSALSSSPFHCAVQNGFGQTCSSAVRVHDSQAYRKIDVTRERISRILELREILCHSKQVSTLSIVLLSVLHWRVSQAWNPHQLQLSPGTWSLWLSQASVHLLNSALMSLVSCHKLGLLGNDLHAVGCGGFVD